MRDKKRLVLEQMEAKLLPYKGLEGSINPSKGWINSIRISLNMTLAQLGKALGMTQQGAKKIEEREASGSITINALREAGEAMDMQLVYGFVPRDGSLEELIQRKATELAKDIVARTHHNMVLEDQAVYGSDLSKPVEKLADELKQELPKVLWD